MRPCKVKPVHGRFWVKEYKIPKTVSLGMEFISGLMGPLHRQTCGLLVEPLYHHSLEVLIRLESLTLSIFLRRLKI